MPIKLKILIRGCLLHPELLFMLVFSPAVGQEKRPLVSADYSLWSKLYPEKISNKGNWVSYSSKYESQQDTLFIQNVKNRKAYVFPKGHNGTFCKEQWFACQTPKDNLELLNLRNGKIATIARVRSFQFLADGRYLILESMDETNKRHLTISTVEGKSLQKYENVSNWKVNQQGSAVAIVTFREKKYMLNIADLNSPITNVMISENTWNSVGNIFWDRQGQGVAFVTADASDKQHISNKIHYYDLNTKQSKSIGSQHFDADSGNWQIDDSEAAVIFISKDRKRVFFQITAELLVKDHDPKAIQFWNTDDKYLFPRKQQVNDWNVDPKIALWEPESGFFAKLTDNKTPAISFSGDLSSAWVYNPADYEPQFKQIGDVDFYRLDFRTGNKEAILEKYAGHEGSVTASPEGRYMAYFKEGNWWVYDLRLSKHTNISKNINVSFAVTDYDMPDERPAYGSPGWTKNDESILLYDQYDIWEVYPDGTKARKLTNGSPQNINFRCVALENDQRRTMKLGGMISGAFDLEKGLILKATNLLDKKSGFFFWDNNTKEQSLVFKDKKIDNILKAEACTKFVWVEQDFDSPPALMYKDGNNAVRLYQSNRQHKHFYWGNSKQIEYANEEGGSLNAALFYPANYNPLIKYPMIVSVYEKQLMALHNYINPTLHNGNGFNITNFTANGYFVLLPDISYATGEPGKSALQCVVSAVQRAIALENIDKEKIGIIGHSFGGYETNFIITQTNIFAAAISGAAVSDFTSASFNVAWNVGKQEYWRYEKQQYRMGTSFFSNKEAYYNNSPLTFAPNVMTPLLAWTGEEDYQVNHYQSVEFYMALRRLKKRHILLVYPNEGHVLVEEKNQEHLTNRIQEWFDHYLKNSEIPNWTLKDYLE